MDGSKRKVLRNLFWGLFGVLTIACVVLNLRMRTAIDETECQTVSVRVVTVRKAGSSLKAAQYSDVELIKVTVSYEGKEYKLKGAVGYDRFKKLEGGTYQAVLYRGKLYYDMANVITSGTAGVIYFTCLGLDVACLAGAVAFTMEKKK